MAKQLNVNLQMTADTSQAAQQLRSLQNQLTQLTKSASTSTSGLGLTKDIQEATSAASKLQIMLKNATTSAGTLDLGQFNQAIKSSGKDLKYYANQLNSLGPQGAQAFAQIAQSITSASVPLKKTNTLLSEFATTLKNTARWQISSSILHGFMGSLQKAYGYAENLNESLNNIRIVTGQSTDQMAKFAKQANEAAQSLSTTTTKYTDAALIFYQQGLTDDLVKEYTDVTIKMANVTGDGAQEVSSYMTAIWNNFNKDGDESAEHFGDVLTALGATTASSSAEIAAGLEKFAAIADVTGLSYDYAAASLATLVASTRQSADVVGTSLKTIFSRMEGVSLGETLEDGVDLNTYSEALAKIGVNILDASGEMRNLDDILDDTAEKWQNLSRAQQMATAQTVAGVRQYNNFISLMDNWDSMEKNLDTAADSDGTLQEQADIYAESWEAARDRVQAAAEAIYQDLLDDDFFITALNGVEHLLDALDNLINGLGGIPGVLAIVSSAMLSAFGKEIAGQINNTFYNLTYSTEAAKQEILDLRQSAIDAMQALGDDSITGSATLDVFKQQGVLQDEILAKTQELTQQHRDLTTEEQQQIQIANDIATAIGQQAIEAAKVREQEEQVTNTLMTQAKQTVNKQNGANGKVFEKEVKDAQNLQQQYALVSVALEKMRKAGKDSFEDVQTYAEKLLKKLKDVGVELRDDVQDALEDITSGNVDMHGGLEEKLNGLSTACDELGADAQTAFEDLEDYGDGSDKFKKGLDGMQQSATNAGVALGQECDQLTNLDAHIEQSTAEIQQFTGAQATFADGIVALGTSLTSVASAIMSIKSLGNIWADEDASTGEKILTTMTTLGMVIPMLTKAFSAENVAKLAGLKLDGKTVAMNIAKVVGVKSETLAHTTNTAAIWKEIAAQMIQNWYYAAIVAVILILIGVIALLTKAYNADAEALADANKNLEDAKNNYDAATSSAEKFRQAVSDYDECLKGLDDLTAGTKEMAEAVEESNKKARELIETYKLFGKYSFGENGEIIIDPVALADAQARMDRIANQAEQVYYLAKAHQSDKQIDNDATQLGRNTLGSMVETYGDSVSVRNASSSEVQALAAAIDKVRDAEGGVELSAEELRERLTENSTEYGLSSSILNNLNSLVNDNTVNALYNFCDAVDEATAANLYYAQQIVNSAAENLYGDELTKLATDEEGNVDEQLVGQMQTAVNAILDRNTDASEWVAEQQSNLSDDVLSNVSTWDAGDVTEDNIKDFLTGLNSDYDSSWLADNYSKMFEGSSLAYDGDINAQEMAQAYYEAQGYTITSVKDKNGYTALSGTDANGNAFDLDVDNEQAQKLWAEQIAAYAISQMAEQMEAENLSEEEVTEIFGSITDHAEQYGADFTNAFLTSISNGSESFDFSSLYSELSPSEHAKLMAMSGEDIAKMFGLTEEQLQKLGYEDAEAFGQAFHDGLDGWDVSDYTDKVNADYKNQAKDLGINEEEFEAYRELLIDTNAVYEDNIEGANMVALANKRMEKGVSALAKDWEDINDIMSDSTSTIEDISTVLPDVNSAMQDILNLDTEEFSLLPPDFAQKHWDLVQDVMNNVEGSVDELRDIAGQEILLNVTGALSTDELDAELLELNNNIAAWDQMNDLTVGVQIDPTDQAKFYANCEALVNKAGMTAAQAEAYFASMGYDVEVEEQPVESTTQASYSYYKLDEAKTEAAGGVPQFSDTATEITVDRNESATALAIKSITPTGSYGGGVGVNTTAPKSSTAPSKSKSGGGGSTPKHKTKESKDKKSEIERYHDVSEALEDVAAKLDMVGKAKDRTFGAGKLKNIKSEIALLEQESELLQQQLDEAKAYRDQDRIDASAYGWESDEDGNITNYEANMNRLLDKINAETEYYNSLTAEAQKAYDEAETTKLDQLEKEYDKAMKAKDRLEESSDKVRDTYKEMQSVAQQIADAELESIEVIVDLKLEVDKAQLKYLQALFDNIGDSADHAADKIENIVTQIGKFGEQMEHQKEGLESYLKLAQKYNSDLSDSNISNIVSGNASDDDLQALAEAVSNSDGTLDMNTIMDKIKDFQSACYENISQLKEWRESVYETLESAIEEYDDKFDRINNKIAHSSKMISSYQDLVAAVGKKNVDPTGELTARLNQNAISTAKSSYDASQSRVDFLKKEVADAEEGLRIAQATGVEADIKHWEDILKNSQDKLMDAEETAMDNLNTWVEQLGKAFEAQIDQIIDNLDKSVGGLSDLREAFDRAQELDAQYLDDYQKIYELSKLTRQVNTSIDETDNVKAKKALMEYQQKINQYQEDGVQMSQYELEYLQKQYDLELAKIALDEAKDAKSQVRMTRDAEGNYGYVYTADDSAVAEAEQNYEDKLYEMQELNAQYINDLQDNIITMQEEMSAKLQEIAEDDSLSYEEKMAKMQEVTDYYTERIDYYNKQLGIVLDNNKSLYENDWREYSEKTGYKISKDEDYIDSWGETTIAIQTGAETQEEYIDKVKNGMQTACDNMQTALSDYQQAVTDATSAVIDGAQEQTDALAETAEEAAEEAEDLEENYEETLGDAMDATQTFTEEYANYIDECIQANLDYIKSIDDVLAKLAELAAAEGSSTGNNNNNNNSGDNGKGDNGKGNNDNNKGSGAGSIEGVAAAIWMDGGATSGWYCGSDRKSRLAEKGVSGAQAYINAHGPNGDIYAAWHNKRDQLKSFYYGAFDTGGYTGEWGDGSGKLALLHSKELVLNAEDTENMLKMVDMVRQITDVIDTNALFSSIASGLTAASVNANSNGTLEQNVTITAEFPNATDKDSILDAFDNVINLAAQYANRK